MKKLAGFIMDDTRPMRDRLFMLLVVSSISTMAVMFFVGIVIGESATDLITLGAGVVLFFIMSVIALKYNLIKILTPVAALILILIVMPVTFFTGGGIYGGSPLWFVFCALFISLLVEGDLKVFLLALDGVVIGICYLAAYRYPSFVTQHDTVEAYWDSFISTIFVCGVLCLMIGFEIRLLKSEMEKSKLKSREIDELNQAQNTFFSSMSHEIRTPINSIIGFNEMILQEDISPEVEENARNIKSSSGVLLSVINDILDMSKMASGKMDIVPVAYDVGDMISEIVNMMWHRASEKGLEFHVSIDPEIPSRLFADEVRIKQILINLLGNAIKYTDNGGITLSLHNGGVSENKILINYSVEDTGIGIRKENIPYLFDAFKRVDEKNNHRIEGTGLGLSIVKQLVELMGGEISVNSVYTRGSTFNVALTQEIVEETPIGKFEAGRTRHHHSDLIKARRSFEAPEARILIVDDNRANLLVEKKLLRNTGMTIDTAESGAECLELTLVTHYDVILMDHLMPEMDGVECFSRIRAQAGGQCQNSPVIVLTANADSVNRALYKRAGFDDYVIKPVDIEVLEGAILAKLPHELVRNVTEAGYTGYDEAAALMQQRRKIPLLITTDSVSDLPAEILEKTNIPVLSYKVYTDKAVFSDGIEAGGDAIVRYIANGEKMARSEAPSVAEYEEFFAKQLLGAQHVLHVAMAKRSSVGYDNACEAAGSFYNVKVINSGHLSSGMGLLAMIGNSLVAEGQTDPERLFEILNEKKEKIHSSFIVDSTLYLYLGGKLSERIYKLTSALMVHPVIELKDSSMKVGRVFLGSRERVKQRYINRVLRNRDRIDPEAVFITYVGMKKAELDSIKEKIQKRIPDANVYIQKASPAISINSGPGTFGILYSDK